MLNTHGAGDRRRAAVVGMLRRLIWMSGLSLPGLCAVFGVVVFALWLVLFMARTLNAEMDCAQRGYTTVFVGWLGGPIACGRRGAYGADELIAWERIR